MSKTKVGYTDGFVLIVPKDKVEEYKKMASEAGEMWMRNGALSYRECIGEDLNPDMQGSEFLPFEKLTNCKADETIWFSYIEYESKEHRDKVNAKVMKECKEKDNESDWGEKMPFDMKKFAYAGFRTEVSF